MRVAANRTQDIQTGKTTRIQARYQLSLNLVERVQSGMPDRLAAVCFAERPAAGQIPDYQACMLPLQKIEGRQGHTSSPSWLTSWDRPMRNSFSQFATTKGPEKLRRIIEPISLKCSCRPSRKVSINSRVRKCQVFRLVIAWLLNKVAAAELGITLLTIKTHRARVMQKRGYLKTKLVRLLIADQESI
jgi:hypothetical protein